MRDPKRETHWHILGSIQKVIRDSPQPLRSIRCFSLRNDVVLSIQEKFMTMTRLRVASTACFSHSRSSIMETQLMALQEGSPTNQPQTTGPIVWRRTERHPEQIRLWYSQDLLIQAGRCILLLKAKEAGLIVPPR